MDRGQIQPKAAVLLVANEEAEASHGRRIERINLRHGSPPKPGLERCEGDLDG